MSRLRYLLVATLACATVGVGVSSVLLGRAYRSEPLDSFPVPARGVLPDPPGSRVSTAKPGSPQAHAEAIVWKAVIAINQYASERDGSYEGATAARLRQVDPRLDRRVRVIDAAAASYCVEARIKGGQASAAVPGWGVIPLLCGSISA